ncbi:MAG TPA: SIS domain-containing protein [Acidobacteriaceae bacterium]|jgi:glucosamine--fructose-6-phosphate aminotransferase (isomerizing)|nr:SIS domain-containing protein [Acidobacteriaceae bacterium]
MQEPRTFAHAMLREIYEQPEALAATMAHYAPGGMLDSNAFAAVADALRGRQRIVIAASGSSRHAGLAGEILLEDYAGLAVDVEYASEYMYRSTHTLHDPGVIVISQSGETADTLASLREANARGLATVAITNNAESSMAREANASLPTLAGREIAVPATKSFTTQLCVLYVLSLFLARLGGRMTAQAVAAHCEQMEQLPQLLQGKLEGWEQQIADIAERLAGAKTYLYLGRAIHYAIAREGALKLKESAYVQAEGLPVGELKHGPNALVSPEAPLVVLATRDRNDPDSSLRYERTLQLMRDMHLQGAEIFSVHVEGDDEAAQLSRYSVAVPAVDEFLLPMMEVVPLQMLAYFTAVQRGINVDAPRNLVKAVVRE